MLDEGDELVEVLTSLCEDHDVTAGEIRAVGHFDRIHLVHFDGVDNSYQTLIDGEGSFELVSLVGNVSRLGDEIALRLEAVFNAAGPAGPRPVAGQLRSARATDAEFVITAFPDLRLNRRLDTDANRLILDGIERRAHDGGKKEAEVADGASTGADGDSSDSDSSDSDSSQMSWDEAIAESTQTEKKRTKRRKSGGSPSTSKLARSERKKTDDPYADFDFDEPLINSGDLLDHPKLGRCRVLEAEDGQYVKVRLPRGRIRKLSLEVIDIEYGGEEKGKRVFEAQVSR